MSPRAFLQKAMEVKYLEENIKYILNNTEPLCWTCKKKNCKNCPLEKNKLFDEYQKGREK